jgi:hypothetical protein
MLWGTIVVVWQIEDLIGTLEGREFPNKSVISEIELRSALQGFVPHEPRIVGVDISENECLRIGIGGPWAFVEHVVDKPWKAQVALVREQFSTTRPDCVSFLCGNQDTEIPGRLLMPVAEAIALLASFYSDEKWPDKIEWELM